jgi:hypothetical protein
MLDGRVTDSVRLEILPLAIGVDSPSLLFDEVH